MDSNMFLVLLGITITVIVGVIGIIYTYRIRNIPKLTFLEQDFFSLFKSINESPRSRATGYLLLSKAN